MVDINAKWVYLKGSCSYRQLHIYLVKKAFPVVGGAFLLSAPSMYTLYALHRRSIDSKRLSALDMSTAPCEIDDCSVLSYRKLPFTAVRTCNPQLHETSVFSARLVEGATTGGRASLSDPHHWHR